MSTMLRHSMSSLFSDLLLEGKLNERRRKSAMYTLLLRVIISINKSLASF